MVARTRAADFRTAEMAADCRTAGVAAIKTKLPPIAVEMADAMSRAQSVRELIKARATVFFRRRMDGAATFRTERIPIPDGKVEAYLSASIARRSISDAVLSAIW